jgi:hypothetical protein
MVGGSREDRGFSDHVALEALTRPEGFLSPIVASIVAVGAGRDLGASRVAVDM